MKRVTAIATVVALGMFIALSSAAQAGQKPSNRQSTNDHKDRHHDGRNDHHDGYHDGHHDHHHDGDSCGNDSCHHHGDCDNGDGWNTIHPIPAPKPIIHRFPVGTIYRLNQTTATGRFKQLGLLNTKLLVGRPPNTTNGTIPTLGNAHGLANEIGSSFGNLAGSVISGAINTAGSVVSDVGNGLEGFASGLLSAL